MERVYYLLFFSIFSLLIMSDSGWNTIDSDAVSG